MNPIPLAAEFPPPDEAAWRKLVEKALKGAPWEKLVGKTADGLALKPLYREPDFPTAEDVSGFPGAAPYIRGAEAARDPHRPWRIRQIVAHPDPARANAEILADLQGGVSSIELRIDPFGANGIAIDAPEHLALALDGVAADLAPIALDASVRPLAAGEMLAAHLRERNLRDAEAAFNVDPIGAFASSGGTRDGVMDAAAHFAKRIASEFPNASALRVDARPVHEAGGSEGQELGAALASGIAYLRTLNDWDIAIDEASRLFLFTLSVGPDVLVETAKLRALRLCWARILEASGARAENRAARIHAITSGRMMTRYDPWTNILRTTAAAFAAAIGGAQAIGVRPFTDALGLPTPFARRIARNTQLILMEESHLGHVVDPAGGAWFVEKLTRELAEAGWAFMQKIETEGGIVETLKRGWLQEEVRAIREAHQRDYATRKQTITGVTDYPLLGADMPDVVSRRGAPCGRPDTATSTKRAPTRGAPTDNIECEPLPQIRWAAPFEALRDKAESFRRPDPRLRGSVSQNQNRASPILGAGGPIVFFATLGALAEFGARSNFACNLLAVGGIAVHEPEAIYGSVAEICASFAAVQTPVAVIVGNDAAYEAQAAEAARALKTVGASWIVLAGRPGAHEEAWRKAGIDQFVFAGQDALESLERLHSALGIAE